MQQLCCFYSIHLQSSPTGPAEHWAGGSLCRSESSWREENHNETTLKTLQGHHIHFELGLQIEELDYFDIYLNTWRDKYSDTVRVKHPLPNWWITNGWLQFILRNVLLWKTHNPLWNFTGIIININVWLYAILASLTLLGIHIPILDAAISLFSGSCLLYS